MAEYPGIVVPQALHCLFVKCFVTQTHAGLTYIHHLITHLTYWYAKPFWWMSLIVAV